MKYLIYIAVLLCFISCEENIDETIGLPDNTENSDPLSNDISVDFSLLTMFHGADLPYEISIKVFENKEEVFSDIIGPDLEYSLDWALNPEIKTYVEFYYERCVDIEYEGYEYLSEGQEILELTPDKNGKKLQIYMSSRYSTKDLRSSDIVKIKGQVQNVFGNPVYASLDLENLDIGNPQTTFDGGYTDENGYFELYCEPNKEAKIYISGCPYGEEIKTDFGDIDLGTIPVCPNEHFASFVTAKVNSCDGLASEGYCKIYNPDPYWNLFAKYQNGVLEMPMSSFGSSKMEVEFYDTNLDLKSPRIAFNMLENTIDLGEITLCEDDQRSFVLSKDGEETLFSNFYIEKNQTRPNQLSLKSPSNFEINFDLDAQQQIEKVYYTHSRECKNMQWINALSEDMFEIDFLEFQNYPVTVKGNMDYYDEILGKNVHVALLFKAPLNIED